MAFLTEEEYLDIERTAEFKSEYLQGEMYPLGEPPTPLISPEAHGLLVSKLVQILTRSQVHAGNIPALAGMYEPPDVIGLTSLIIEVLSPSTEAYDRGRKFDHYKTIPSLKEYLLVSADRIHIDLYTRQPEDRWLLTSADSVEESVELQSVAVRLSLAELYADIPLAA